MDAGGPETERSGHESRWRAPSGEILVACRVWSRRDGSPANPGLIVLNDTDAIDETAQHGRWRRWLALFNTFQALPGFLMATERGLEMRRLRRARAGVVAGPAEGPAATLGGAWASAFQSAVEDAAVGLRRLADAGVDIPEVGYEYADDEGVVIAEAELAWPRSKVCVLLDSQAEFSRVRGPQRDGEWLPLVRRLAGGSFSKQLNKGSEDKS